MKVTVSCSGKFHAFHLAEQLNKANSLDKLFTTYAYQKNTLLSKLIRRRDYEKIPANRIDTNILPALGFRAMPGQGQYFNNLYDSWVSRQLRRTQTNLFIGWSGMSLHSMAAAKAAGAVTIVERGSSHIQFQHEILSEEFKRHDKAFAVDPRTIEKELLEYEQADYISIPSGFVKQTFLDKGIPESKLLHNPYGVSSFFTPANVAKEEKFTILYLGRLNIHKGAPYLFEALSKLNIPEHLWQVNFVGAVDAGVEALIEKYRKPNWNFLGHQDHYSLSQYVTACHVAVHPSLEEGLSMVIPQMLSCGVPVIATTNTGGGDIIRDGENGFIVPIRNPAAIQYRIMEVFEDRDLLARMSANAANIVNAGFTWNDYGNRYYQNLKNILSPSTTATVPDSSVLKAKAPGIFTLSEAGRSIRRTA